MTYKQFIGFGIAGFGAVVTILSGLGSYYNWTIHNRIEAQSKAMNTKTEHMTEIMERVENSAKERVMAHEQSDSHPGAVTMRQYNSDIRALQSSISRIDSNQDRIIGLLTRVNGNGDR